MKSDNLLKIAASILFDDNRISELPPGIAHTNIRSFDRAKLSEMGLSFVVMRNTIIMRTEEELMAAMLCGAVTSG